MSSLAFHFRFDKALQATGLFLQLNGGRMEYLKLLKLLYLADRECLAEEGDTITGDSVRAMRKGPVLFTVYNLIKDRDSQSPRWHRYIKNGGNHSVYIAESPGTLDLYRFEKDIIKRLDVQHKDKDGFDLVDLTHTFPEWKKYEARLNTPGQRKSCWISIEDILEGLEKKYLLEQVQGSVSAERFHRNLHHYQ